MRKITIMLIVLMIVGLGILSGCNTPIPPEQENMYHFFVEIDNMTPLTIVANYQCSGDNITYTREAIIQSGDVYREKIGTAISTSGVGITNANFKYEFHPAITNHSTVSCAGPGNYGARFRVYGDGTTLSVIGDIGVSE